MDGEVEMIQCFFEPSHMIYRTRYPYHYQRCSRQHPHIRHKVCPYNATHVMDPEVYDAHLNKCESRPPPTMTASKTAPCKSTEASVPAPVDSWDEGADDWTSTASVIPQSEQRNNIICAPLIGASRAERVQHRLAERRQYQQMEDSKKSREVQSDKDKKKKKKKKKAHNSKSNSENVDGASGNKPIPTNAGNAPLAERSSATPESLNLAGLSLKD